MVQTSWTPDAKAYGNDQFVSEYVAKYGGAPGDISADAAGAYSVRQVVDQASQKANSIENKALITALHSRTYNTVQDPMSFDSSGKPQWGGAVDTEQWNGGGGHFA